jgi:hypothetical protein
MKSSLLSASIAAFLAAGVTATSVSLHAAVRCPVIAVSLSDTGGLPILLQLDAGSDGPILYAGNRKLEQPFLKHETLQRDNVSKAQQAFALLPPQNMQIGTRTLRKCPVRDPGEHRGESSEA